MENELIEFCQQIKLYTRPNGDSDTQWLASCPSGGNHSIIISTLSNEWGCGYCRKKGGLQELKEWIESKQNEGL